MADTSGEMAWELSRHSQRTEIPVAPENLETMVMPPEMSTTNQTSQTDATVQGNIFRENEKRVADLPAHIQWTKICSDAGLAKTVDKGQYFTTLDDDQLDRQKRSCREYTLPRSDQTSQVKDGSMETGRSVQFWM